MLITTEVPVFRRNLTRKRQYLDKSSYFNFSLRSFLGLTSDSQNWCLT